MYAKRFTIVALLLGLLVHGLFAAEPTRVAVSDFQVQSDNPQYKYLGKGFAEFVAIEILKSGQLTLIERKSATRSWRSWSSVLRIWRNRRTRSTWEDF